LLEIGIDFMKKYFAGFLLFVYLFIVNGIVRAYTFVPTELEFEAWPYKCKAIYVGTTVGKKTTFSNRIPAKEVNEWRTIAQHEGGAWHYCAGLVYLSRGRTERFPEAKKVHLDRALAEISYTYTRIKKGSPWTAEVGVSLARVYRSLGESEKALDVLQKIIRIAPEYAHPYFLSALIYKDKNDLKAAKEVLLTGNKKISHKSADMFYMLGLVSLKLGEITKAREYADTAYDLGYPLPWLKNELVKIKK